MNQNEKKLLGERIKELRRGKGLSQEVLAERAETSQNYLSRMECGKENPTLDMLIKLAHSLDVEMNAIFDFGHVVGHKQLKEAIQAFSRTADEDHLRLAVKFIRTVSK